MKTSNIPNTDLIVSRIAYGCAAFGSFGGSKSPGPEASPEAIARFKADHDQAAIERFQREPPRAEAVSRATGLVQAACDHGINLFDHADIYVFGKSEQVFGEVLKQSPGLRDRVIIQTKCGIRFAGNLFTPQPGDPHRVDFSAAHIVRSVEGSLRRLQTDRIDILLLHRPDALVEPEEVAEAFDELQRAGKVRHFGVSNHTGLQIELLRKYVRQPLVVNQLQLSLAYPYLITDGIDANREDSARMTHGYTGVAGTLDYCRLHDIQVQAYSPLKGGAPGPPRLIGPADQAPPETRKLAQLLSDLATRKEVTVSAIALAWLLRHPARIVPIIGTTQPAHIAENVAADGISLTREEWYDLLAAGMGVSSLLVLGLILPKELQ